MAEKPIEEITIEDELSDLEWVNIGYHRGNVLYKVSFMRTDNSIAPCEQVSGEEIPPEIYRRMLEKASEFLSQKNNCD